MINKILRNNGHTTNINFVLEDTDLFEVDYCNEYLLEDELDALQESQFNEIKTNTI